MVAPPAPAATLSPPAAALALVPGLQQGGVPRCLERLAGGQVNDTWRVDTAAGRYTLRLDGPLALRPGVDRGRELRLHALAAAAGLAPRIVRTAPAAGALVCEFLSGRTWSDADFQDAAALGRLGERLHVLHCLATPALPGSHFDPCALTRGYLEQARAAGVPLDAADSVQAQLRRAVAIIEAAAVSPSIVHGDLPYGNVLEDARLWLLDWEYAQLADPIYDVACIVAHLPLAAGLQRQLLAASGLGAPQDAGRLPAAAFVYRALTWAWHLARAERCAAPSFG
jgi:thiamine kinase